ncbi:TIGR01777 family oxidoreductase [Candidatus Mycalebacterium sp.]
MKVLVSGSGGFIGKSLVSSLKTGGHEVIRIVRDRRRARPQERAVLCDPVGREFNPRDFEGADAVIHLAGRNIMRRWTDSAKAEIECSRVAGTEFLASALAGLENPPKVFLCASATGFYGDRDDEILSERSGAGEGFLARVAEKWENAAKAAGSATRVVNLRFGMVLARDGAALKMMRIPFLLGLGTRIGDGSGYMSWISKRDAVRAMEFILANDSVSGPVNIVSPVPMPNADFTRCLARVLGRPVFLSLSARIIKFVFGEMGEEVIMSSVRVVPEKLISAGFRFEDGNLEAFLRAELKGTGL